ncbi:MAG: class II fructose-bisphosphate aldolase [Pirellulales bacterium]
MPLESVQSLIEGASRGGYALGYFESWDAASLQGVLDAAEHTRSPIIIGFNGDFLSNPQRRVRERLELYAGLGRAAAESASVPCGLLFNECSQDPWTIRAIHAGFNMVCVAASNGSPQAHASRVAEIVSIAHRAGVAVEAEFGELPCGVSKGIPVNGMLTEPAAAANFVKNTGVDLLGVSVGNIHIQVEGDCKLNLDHLAVVRKATSIPLVLHGGSGIRSDSLTAAIAMGVRKVNYGTYLKQRCLNAIRGALGTRATNPHELLGMGGVHDMLDATRIAVRDATLERIEWLGCCGKA